MSRQRRNFSAKFKSDLVIELLKGEKDLNTLATENNIQPNLLRNWKKEFLNDATVVFDDKREENLKEKLAEERKEKAEYAKKASGIPLAVKADAYCFSSICSKAASTVFSNDSSRLSFHTLNSMMIAKSLSSFGSSIISISSQSAFTV